MEVTLLSSSSSIIDSTEYININNISVLSFQSIDTLYLYILPVVYDVCCRKIYKYISFVRGFLACFAGNIDISPFLKES